MDYSNDSADEIMHIRIANLKVVPINSTKDEGAILAFSAEVYPDGDIFTVAAQKKKLEEEARGSDVRGECKFLFPVEH